LPESSAVKIEELNRELSALKQERERLSNESRAWAEKRNAIHEQVKTLHTEAKSLKEKRDTINQQVKELKGLREQARSQQKEKRTQILKAKEKMRVIMEKKPSRPMADIQKEIDSLEWRIQTTSMPVKEEKMIVDQIRVLESQRAIHRQLQELKNTLVELQTEEKAFATQAKVHHQTLAELAAQGQKFHEKMLELLTQARNLRSEADAAHQKHVEFRQKTNEVHQKCLRTLQQINVLRQEIQQKEETLQAKKQQGIREEAVKKAQEKMKRGEKLTWEEFQLLAEQGAL
jgi:phosphoserine phosphatase